MPDRLCSRPTHHGKTEMPQELDEVEGPDELIEGDLDELADDDDLIAEEDALVLPDDDDADVVVVEEDLVDIDDADVVVVEEDLVDIDDADVVVVEEDLVDIDPKVPTKAAAAGEEAEEEEEEEPDDEDVEASLDTILKERLVVEEVEDDEDAPEPEDRSGDGVERVLPKQPGEFVCRSCFLVKHPNQLADRKKMLCRDCV
jgi:hypothetical protein